MSLGKAINQFDVATSPENINLLGHNTVDGKTMQVPSNLIKQVGTVKRRVLYEDAVGQESEIETPPLFNPNGSDVKTLVFEVSVSNVVTQGSWDEGAPPSETLAKKTLLVTVSSAEILSMLNDTPVIYNNYMYFVHLYDEFDEPTSTQYGHLEIGYADWNAEGQLYFTIRTYDTADMTSLHIYRITLLEEVV